MAGIIDADTHIAESESMWKHFDPSMHHRRPVMVSAPDDTLYRDFNVLWLIDGNIFPKASGKGGFRIITPTASKREAGRTDIALGCREITDVPARLADMDHAGVDTQVIYPTLFLIDVTDDTTLQVALCGAYNKFLGEVYGKSNNRLRWVTVLPLKSVDASIKQMHEAKENGAVGIFFSGIIGSLTLNNPHFMPIYAEAEKLGLPICVHTGQSSRHLLDFFDLELNGTFATSHVPPIVGFRDLVSSAIPEKFPSSKIRLPRSLGELGAVSLSSPEALGAAAPKFSQCALEVFVVQRTVPRLPHLRRLRSGRRHPLPGGIYRRRQFTDRLRLRPQRSGGRKSIGANHEIARRSVTRFS